MKASLSQFPPAIVVLLIAIAPFTGLHAQQPNDPADEKSGEFKLVDPNSETLNPLLPDFDDEAKTDQFGEVAQPNDALASELFGEIPAATRTQFRKNILPAIQSGANRDFLNAMERLIETHPPESITALEKYCVGIGLGPLRQRFTEILLEGIEQGLPINARQLNPVFAEYTSSALMDVMESELELVSKHAIMQDPLVPLEDWQESDEFFWEIHVWKNRFLNMNRLVQYTINIHQPLLQRATKQQDQIEIDRLQKPAQLAAKINSAFAEMLEREAEIRLIELAKAEKTLRTNEDFEQRLHAAFALEMHGGELDIFFRNHQPGTFIRPVLNDQQKIDAGIALLESGREHGRDVIEKAVLLRVGAHWWLRGRYGMATLAQGLLKPEQAMQSNALMFGLFMPKDRPRAVGEYDETTGNLSPGYERRHYFTWAVERRDVFVNSSTRKFTETDTKPVGDLTSSHFY